MKLHFLYLLVAFVLLSKATNAQIEKVIVETYYVSDSLDATDTTALRSLPKGSKTYRVYLDLKRGSKIKKIYGAQGHPLKINSTANFFNNIDRPSEYFGYLIKKNYFPSNPTLALDSWITLGLATTLQNGVLKVQDTDGSFIGGAANFGGSSSVPGGILVNTDPMAGASLTSKDGFMPNSATLSTWFDNGFKDAANVDTTVFGSVQQGSSFYSTTAFLQQNSGVSGHIPDSNQVLVAQLTTLGDISFELNVDIIDSVGNTINYISSNPYNSTDSIVSPFLKYPEVCGCTDARYIEFSPAFACSNSSACQTLKRFGCTDSFACNYDPSANILLPNFCCYPGYCNDRDVGLVCPNLSANKIKNQDDALIYPNPLEDQLNIEFHYASDPTEIKYSIYDCYYNKVIDKSIGIQSGKIIITEDVSQLQKGFYVLYISAGGNTTIKKFSKK